MTRVHKFKLIPANYRNRYVDYSPNFQITARTNVLQEYFTLLRAFHYYSVVVEIMREIFRPDLC